MYDLEKFSFEELSNMRDALSYVRGIFYHHNVTLDSKFIESSKELSKVLREECNKRDSELPY